MKTENSIQTVENTIKEQAAVILYFYNDDCPPCISLRPKVEQMVKSTFPKMDVVWVNSKETPDIPAKYGVFGNPTLLLFFDGKETRRFSKYISIDELSQSIERYYGLMFG